MLNPDFYPTNEPQIRQLLTPWLSIEKPYGRPGVTRPALATMTILDPSAGSGKILDWIVDHIYQAERGDYGHKKDRNLYAIELDPELRATLHGKSYKVIADDFLEYTGDHQFDLVVMNPPFSAGAEHVLHAFHIVAPGGHVAALVNAETILNPYTEARQLLAKLIEDYGSVEQLGQVFLEAERTTDVHVALIRLQRPTSGTDPLRFDFATNTREDAPDLSEETFMNAVATRDVIGNMMAAQGQVKQAFVAYLKATAALRFYSKELKGGQVDIVKLAEEAIQDGAGSLRASYNSFSDTLKQHSWGQVLDKMDMQKFMTHKVRQDFHTFGRNQGYMQFSKENVVALIEMLYENSGTILEQAVVDVFDIFTRFYSDNRLHVEGWKTNDRFKVNRRIILPNWVRCDDWSTAADMKKYGSCFRLSSHHSSEFSDVDKVFCYLTGTDYKQCYTIEKALEVRFKRIGKLYPGDKFDSECESEFFNIRFYKKGTIHLEIRDERVWQEFNLRACAGKLWLAEPEMKAYRARKHSPFQQPAPEPTPAVAPPTVPAMRASGPGTQLSLLGDFGQDPPALAA